ncbi:hypothetical protein [Parapedobacter sp. DT-150]|uniref:hypothetical protein n=1 Tax=Parapedobacter sp. DT-150 TaxID=3396162 RepID=UPI003F1B5AD6
MAATPEQHHENTSNTTRERLAQNIAGRITRTQTCVAGRLNRAFSRLGRVTQLIAMALVLAAMAAYCAYLVFSNLP